MSRIKITFMADKEDREYLRILAAKADCSQGELLLKLMHGYGETLVRVMREGEILKKKTEVVPMITKKFGVDFHSEGGALTLSPDEVSPGASSGTHERTHDDGWTIKAQIHEDYYTWINYFEASHPTYGRVWGDFEDEVYADSEEGFQDFYTNHLPEPWDYGDI